MISPNAAKVRSGGTTFATSSGTSDRVAAESTALWHHGWTCINDTLHKAAKLIRDAARAMRLRA